MVVYTSFIFVEIIKEISNRFDFSKTFIGSSVLAICTSLPELINAITAGIYDRKTPDCVAYSINSFYNISGSNILQNVFLSVVLFFFGIYAISKQKFDEFKVFGAACFYKKVLLWFLILFNLVLLLCMLFFRQHLQFLEYGGISWLSGIFLLLWLSFFVITFKQTKEAPTTLETEIKSDMFSHLSMRNFLFLGIFVWIIFSILSYVNFLFVSQLNTLFHIPKNISLGIILSFITSVPEFSSFYFLFRSKSYKMAAAGLLGSSLFNMTLPFITSVISGKWIFSHPTFSEESQKITVWLLTDLLIHICLFLSTLKIEKAKFIYKTVVLSAVNIFAYVGATIFIYLM